MIPFLQFHALAAPRGEGLRRSLCGCEAPQPDELIEQASVLFELLAAAGINNHAPVEHERLARERQREFRVLFDDDDGQAFAGDESRRVSASSDTMIGARPSNGSSRISNCGLVTSARAIASICCSPPES